MRLDDLPSSLSAPDLDFNSPSPLIQGTGLWGPFFAAYWITTSLFAALVYLPLLGPRGLLSVALWSTALGAVAIFTCLTRPAIHDLLTSLNERERLAIGVIVCATFLMPAVVRGPRILHDGFLWAAPLMLLFSVNPIAARRHLAWTLAGTWFAAWEIQSPGALVLLLIFGLSWLAALGLTHFTFTGEPHGLAGWWSIKRVGLNALLTTIPATMTGTVAWLMWQLWKSPAPAGPGAHSSPASPDHSRLADRMDPMELMELIWWGAATIGLTVLLFIMLYYLRKFFLKRRRSSWDPDVLPGQVARMEYRAAPPPTPTPSLSGLRGKIIAYWGAGQQ